MPLVRSTWRRRGYGCRGEGSDFRHAAVGGGPRRNSLRNRPRQGLAGHIRQPKDYEGVADRPAKECSAAGRHQRDMLTAIPAQVTDHAKSRFTRQLSGIQPSPTPVASVYAGTKCTSMQKGRSGGTRRFWYATAHSERTAMRRRIYCRPRHCSSRTRSWRAVLAEHRAEESRTAKPCVVSAASAARGKDAPLGRAFKPYSTRF